MQLVAYKAEHGNCNVPKCWAEDPKLGEWVSTQRTGKRQLDRGGSGSWIKGMMAVLGSAWEDPIPAVGERWVGAVSSIANLVDSYF